MYFFETRWGAENRVKAGHPPQVARCISAFFLPARNVFFAAGLGNTLSNPLPVLLKHGEHGPSDRLAPNYTLYGSEEPLADILHCERISVRSATNNWVILRHRHVALHQFIAINRGGGVIVIDGEAFVLEAGTLVNIPIARIHEIHFQEATEGYVVSVPVQELPEVMRISVADPTRLAVPFVIRMSDRVAALFPEIETELASNEIYRTPALRALAMRLSIETVRLDQKSRGQEEKRAQSAHLARFLPMIRANLKQRWSVAEYARATGVSRVSPSHYRARRRDSAITTPNILSEEG